jgi:hypothetical protein
VLVWVREPWCSPGGLVKVCCCGVKSLWFMWWSLCVGDVSHEALLHLSMTGLLAVCCWLCRQHRGACSD